MQKRGRHSSERRRYQSVLWLTFYRFLLSTGLCNIHLVTQQHSIFLVLALEKKSISWGFFYGECFAYWHFRKMLLKEEQCLFFDAIPLQTFSVSWAVNPWPQSNKLSSDPLGFLHSNTVYFLCYIYYLILSPIVYFQSNSQNLIFHLGYKHTIELEIKMLTEQSN